MQKRNECRRRATCILAATALLTAGCATGPSVRYTDAQFLPYPLVTEYGDASWYDTGWFGFGSATASGEKYRPREMTAAHKHLHFGSFVRVTNLRNSRQTIVRITDRGPFVRGRIIDLSTSAARDLELIGPGTAPVRVEAIQPVGPLPVP